MDQARLQHAVLEQMPHALVVWQLTGGDARSLSLVAANAAASRLSGFDLLPWLGRPLAEVCPRAVEQGRLEAYSAALQGGVQRPLPVGSYPELGAALVSGVLLPLGDEHVAVMFDAASSLRDDELRLRNSFLDSIVDNIPTMVFVKNAVDLRYELYNRAGEMLSGLRREDVLGRDDREVFPKEAEFFQMKDREVLQGGLMVDIPEEPLDTPAGRRWLHTKKIPLFHADGSPAHLVGISLDITERKLAVEALEQAQAELEQRVADRTRALQAAEEQLRHAQKMEAVGRLARARAIRAPAAAAARAGGAVHVRLHRQGARSRRRAGARRGLSTEAHHAGLTHQRGASPARRTTARPLAQRVTLTFPNWPCARRSAAPCCSTARASRGESC